MPPNKTSKLSVKQRKRQRTKNIILKSSEELFSTNSYDEVTVEDIAYHAALSKPTLYNYFESKADIFFSIAVQGLKKKVKHFKALVEKEMTGKEKILTAANNFFNDILEHPLHYRIQRKFISVMHEDDSFLERRIRELMDHIDASKVFNKGKFEESIQENPTTVDLVDQIKTSLGDRYSLSTVLQLAFVILELESHWVEIIKEGQQDESVRDDFNPDKLVQIIFLMIYGFSSQYIRKKDHLKIFEFTGDDIKDIMLESLERYLVV